jgi:predicted nucleic acid-binding protein
MGRFLGSAFAAQARDATWKDEPRREAPRDMKIMLDTDTCIAIVNRDERVRRHLEAVAPSQLRISAVTLAELKFGVAKSSQPRRATFNVRSLLSKVTVVPFDEDACERYGDLRALLERKGRPSARSTRSSRHMPCRFIGLLPPTTRPSFVAFRG